MHSAYDMADDDDGTGNNYDKTFIIFIRTEGSQREIVKIFVVVGFILTVGYQYHKI